MLRRMKIMEFIRAYIRAHTYPPTLREIGQAVNIPSTNTVSWYLQQLDKRGELELIPRTSRGIRLPHSPSFLKSSYMCHYPGGCSYTSPRAGDCPRHGTPLLLNVWLHPPLKTS